MNRIEFIQSTLGISALFGLSLAACNDKENLQDLVNNTRLKVSGNMFNFSAEKIKKVRIGIIGLGNRGNVLLQMCQYLVEKEHAEYEEYLKKLEQEEEEMMYNQYQYPSDEEV